MAHHKFTQGFPMAPSILKSWIDELNKGYAYIYKRDRSFRPIFHINLNKLKKIKTDHETLVNMSTFMIQFIISRGLVPGKVENWVTIIDFKGVGVLEIPKKLIQTMTKPLQDLFKGRLFKLYIINSQWAIKIVWALAKKVVDPLTIMKFSLQGDKYHEELGKLIDPSSLERKFGGTLPDKEDNFFPPDLL
jgi:CRAL/TRIO domain